MLIDEEQFVVFAPSLDAKFHARCVQALRERPQYAALEDGQIEPAVDRAIERAQALGLSEERCILAYLLLATDIVLAKPVAAISRVVEAILGDQTLTEWQRVRFGADYFHHMHRPRG